MTVHELDSEAKNAAGVRTNHKSVADETTVRQVDVTKQITPIPP